MFIIAVNVIVNFTTHKKPGLNLGGFDDWEDTDPVYNLDTTLGKCSLSKRVTLSPLSYHRAGNKYNLERKGVDPYNIVDKRTMITKSNETQAFGLVAKFRSHFIPTVSSSPAAAKFKTVSLAEKVLRSPEKYSASFSGTRFTGEKFSNIGGEVPETYCKFICESMHPCSTYVQCPGTTLEVKESEKKSPTYRSGVPRFSAFGTSRNTKGLAEYYNASFFL
eukprot:jgi/Bigna1/78724/fgenesh1_pg.56_\